MSIDGVLAYEYRGDVVENISYGRIAVVDENQKLIGSVGDVTVDTFYRSASKPIQALPVLLHGLEKKYGLNDQEIAIMSGSHAGESFHIKAIEGLLSKSGFAEDDMMMLPSYPVLKKDIDDMISKGLAPRKAIHNCAAKHIALLMLERELAPNPENDYHNYYDISSKAQQEVLKVISEMANYPEDKIKIGIDGCGVSVFALPLVNMAISYMHLAYPQALKNKKLEDAIMKNNKLIHENNLYMRGTGFLCSIFNEDSNIIAKGGAEAVYGFGLKKEKIGVCFKISDGTENNWPFIIAEILKQLKYDNKETIEKILGIKPSYKTNSNNQNIGDIKTAFSLF